MSQEYDTDPNEGYMSFTVQRVLQESDPWKLETIIYSPDSHCRDLPLLFIHGAWHAAWCWEEYFLPFFASSGFPSIAMSLRGHGGSEGADALSLFRLQDYVEDVASVIEVVEKRFGRKPLLIGHSMGGFIAQKYMETHTVPGCVLLAPVPPTGMKTATWNLFTRHPIVTILSLLTTSPNWLLKIQNAARNSLFSSTIPEHVTDRFVESLQAESARAMLDLYIPLSARLADERTPLLVMGAANDNLLAVADIKTTAEAYHTSPVLLPDTAHDIMLDPQWRKAAARILVWIIDTVLAPNRSLHAEKSMKNCLLPLEQPNAS